MINIAQRYYRRKPLTTYILLLFQLLKLNIWWKLNLIALWEYYLLIFVKLCFILIIKVVFMFVWKSVKLVYLLIIIVFLFVALGVVYFIFDWIVFVVYLAVVLDYNIVRVYGVFRLIRHRWRRWFKFSNLDASRHFSRGVSWLTFHLQFLCIFIGKLAFCYAEFFLQITIQKPTFYWSVWCQRCWPLLCWSLGW